MNIEFELEFLLMLDIVKKELPKALDSLEEKGTPVYVGINENGEIRVLTLDPNYKPNLQRWADIRDSYMEMYADCN